MKWPVVLEDMILIPRSFFVRRVLGLMMMVLVGVFLDKHYSAAQGLWISLTSILLMQASIRVSLRQILVRFSVMVFVMAVGTWLISPDLIYAREHDVVCGGLLALLAYATFFPARSEMDFRQAAAVLLQCQGRYLEAIQSILLYMQHDASFERRTLEALQADVLTYPEWVYASGFNPSLELGHRHFLLGVERITDILYGMENAARELEGAPCLNGLSDALKSCVQETQKLLDSLARILTDEDVWHPAYNLKTSVTTLEQALRLELGMPDALLDRSNAYLPWYAILYGFNDLQKTLSKLAEALR